MLPTDDFSGATSRYVDMYAYLSTGVTVWNTMFLMKASPLICFWQIFM